MIPPADPRSRQAQQAEITAADAMTWLVAFADFLRQEAPDPLKDDEWFAPLIGGTALRDFLEFADLIRSGHFVILDAGAAALRQQQEQPKTVVRSDQHTNTIAVLNRLLLAAGDGSATRSEKGRYLGQDAVNAISDAITSLRAAPPTCATWQPIETAPKDGTVIVLLEPKELTGRTRYGRLSIGYWAETRQYVAGGYWSDDSFTGISEPTHWQPLPASPVPDPASTETP